VAVFVELSIGHGMMYGPQVSFLSELRNARALQRRVARLPAFGRTVLPAGFASESAVPLYAPPAVPYPFCLPTILATNALGWSETKASR